MIETIKAELRSLTAAATALDEHLVETRILPDLIAARALVELSRLSDKLEKVRGTLVKAAAEPPANGNGTGKRRGKA